MNAYIRSAIPELEDRREKPLCKHFNQDAAESISWISLDDYTTENKLGMKRWELRTGPGGLPVRRLMDAPTLTMEDFMGLTTLEEQADRSLVGMPKAFSDFTEMFAVDYNLLKEQLSKENGKEVTLEDYLLSIRDAGKFEHKMNKPVQEFLSVVLDATIVKLLIESMTGKDMITGEDLSDFEREMKIVSGVVSLFTLGQGGVVISSGRVVMQSTLVTMGKMVAIDMVTTGVTYGTSELCQKMGLPGSVTMLLSMLAGGKAGSVLNNKWLANVSAEDAARYWKNLEPGEKLSPGMTGDEYAKYLEGLGRVDDVAALEKVDYDEVLKLRKEVSRGKAGMCFVEGTLVAIENGYIKIENIAIGDKVLSQNENSGQKMLKSVKRIFVNKATQLVRIRVAGQEISTTKQHLFYVFDYGWKEAGNLTSGERLISSKNKILTIESVKHIELDDFIFVYNFEVEGWHTYFVTKENVLVHNDCSIGAEKWNKGTFDTSEDSLMYHFKKHGQEVGASDVEQYLRKAEAFSEQLKGATKKSINHPTPGVTRYYKNGKYIDKIGNQIVSFGKQ